MELEAKDTRNIALRELLWLEVLVCHQEQMRERCPKVCAVDVALVLGPWVVDVFTLGAVYLHGTRSMDV